MAFSRLLFALAAAAAATAALGSEDPAVALADADAGAHAEESAVATLEDADADADADAEEEAGLARRLQVGGCKTVTEKIETCKKVKIKGCKKWYVSKLGWRYYVTASTDGKSFKSGKEKKKNNAGNKALNGLFKKLDAKFDKSDCNCGTNDYTITDKCKLRVSICFELNLPKKTGQFRARAWDIDNKKVSGSTPSKKTYSNATFAAEMATKDLFQSNPKKVMQCAPQQVEQDINAAVYALMAMKANEPEFAVGEHADFAALAEMVEDESMYESSY